MIKVLLKNITIFAWRRKIHITIVYNYNIIWYNIVYNYCVYCHVVNVEFVGRQWIQNYNCHQLNSKFTTLTVQLKFIYEC